MRVGILGAGGMGNAHARQYAKMSDVEMAVYDPDADRRALLAERWGAQVIEDESALLAFADFVDVCLPTDLHKPLALKAIAAGRAVFVEKPLARTLEDAVQVVSAADRAGVPLMVGHVVRFFPEFRAGRQTVVNGGIGKPAAARTRRGGLAPTGLGGWFMDHERSGGVLLDLAIHDFDWLRWTLGEVKHLYSRSVGVQRKTGPDYALTILTFESGAVAHVESTWMDPSGFRTTFEVCGSTGMIDFDSRATPSLRTHTAGKTVAESNLAELDDPYYKELRAFVDALKGNGEIPVSGLDGLHALSISLAALESAQTGRVVAPSRAF